MNMVRVLVDNRDAACRKIINIHGHHITESSRVLVIAVFRLICGDVEANIQGVKSGIQSRHVHTHDTCVFS